jgi:hypothetical protein
MSFEAKRLRVQLPCGEATVIEEGAQQATPLCRIPSIYCRQFCTQFTPCLCSDPTPCHYGTIACYRYNTGCFGAFISHCYAGTCGFVSPIPCVEGTFRCPGGSEQPGDPGPIVIDAEHLPALREALEAQLKEIESAEQALRERGGEE